MKIINVTTWAGRKLHLANPESDRGGLYLRTLCDADGVTPGGKWVRWTSAGLMTQDRIDKLEPCKKCEKRRANLDEEPDDE